MVEYNRDNTVVSPSAARSYTEHSGHFEVTVYMVENRNGIWGPQIGGYTFVWAWSGKLDQKYSAIRVHSHQDRGFVGPDSERSEFIMFTNQWTCAQPPASV